MIADFLIPHLQIGLVQLITTISPSNANTETDVTFSSSNPEIVEITETGSRTCTIKARNTPGTSVITATTKNGISVSVTITVTITNIVLTDENGYSYADGYQMAKGEEEKFIASRSGTFTSSDSSVAKVDQDGIVTALKGGVTTITVTDDLNGSTDSIDITVFDVTFKYLTDWTIDNNVLYSNGYVGSAYATASVVVKDVYTENFNGTIKGRIELNCTKTSGLAGPHKINIFAYDEDGYRLDKATWTSDYIAPGQSDSGSYPFSLKLSAADKGYEREITIKLGDVAW